MFGQSKSVAFDPYGRRRRRAAPPRWLVLLLIGATIGAAGVVLVQQRYLPERLSPQASAELRNAFVNADAARGSLERRLSESSRQLATAQADRNKLTDELARTRPTLEALRADLAAVIDALPADPRGGAVEIRAGRLGAKGATLSYDLVLTHERAGAKPMAASVQFGVAGDTARGTPGTFTVPPLPVSIGSWQVLRGSVALPDGFRARQATIQIVDGAGKSLGMRVLLIR